MIKELISRFIKKKEPRYKIYIFIPNDALNYLKHILRRNTLYYTLYNCNNTLVYELERDEVDMSILSNSELVEYLEDLGDKAYLLIEDRKAKLTYDRGNKELAMGVVNE
jgi:hypothetical protein